MRVMVFAGHQAGQLRQAMSGRAESDDARLSRVSFDLAELPSGNRGAPVRFDVPAGYEVAALQMNNVLWPESRIEPAFDLMMHSVADGHAAPEVAIVPVNLMRQLVSDVVNEACGPAFRSLMKGNVGIRICMGPPAPGGPAAQASEADRRSALLRLKLWTLLQQCLASFCRANAIVFLGNPHGSRLPSGFMRPGLAGITNEAYGQKVLVQIARVATDVVPDLPELL